ncbi:heat-labile enterotoxin subunit alpha [Enterobacter cloacae complex sp. P32C]|uniref:enterotoxin A family protein n=1 Tax=Enterobacter cloacae complex sp. P32C TaxID=2779559 RepID=UPI001865C7C4|nr:enterotoxin A family protein [Enterobacter cloacae complex sp. P32C]MBE3211146.1 heat-labile enterotoxin subunit alpha [Enterobacter cloacae complex sp. P32C]
MKLFLLIITIHFVSFSTFAETPKVVYRSVLESPDDIRRTGGFLPRGADGTRPFQPPPNISLFNHTNGSQTGLARFDSGYVSTTTSLNLAHLWVNQNLGGIGYIYHIHPTGNFIDVNATLRQFSPHSGELEYAALGTIRWNQIIGWQRVHYGVIEDFVRNRDYNENLYAHAHAGEEQPQLAGFPYGHVAWTLEPWRNFAHCSNTLFNSTEQCEPVERSEVLGSAYFIKTQAKALFLFFSADFYFQT